MNFCIFSFNRGEFLKNCVESLEQCAPGSSITIFDDNSDDRRTCEVLTSLAGRHTVVFPGTADTAPNKHGGLYANMQEYYLQQAPGALMCFLQDDMQMVRDVAADEIAALRHYFDATPDAGFVQPAFFKGCVREEDAPLTRVCGEAGGYHVDRLQSSAGAWYSDILVASVDNLRAVDWRFLPRESSNEQQARKKLGQLVYLRNPFVAWLPYAPAYRGKTRTFALRHAERKTRSGFYPFLKMSQPQRQAFLERHEGRLPFAEDFLSVAGDPLPEPWIYYPLQGHRLLKTLNNVELRLRRILAG